MKKSLLLLVISLTMQSCFSTRQVPLQSELRRIHIGFSSTSDIKAMYGYPDEQYMDDSKASYVYYSLTEKQRINPSAAAENKTQYTDAIYAEQRVRKSNKQGTTRFSFDEKGIVQNVLSDHTVGRTRFDGGATGAAIGLGIVAIIGIPILIAKLAISQ